MRNTVSNPDLPPSWDFCTPEEAVFQLPNGNYQSIFWLGNQLHATGWMKDREHSLQLAGDKERGQPVRSEQLSSAQALSLANAVTDEIWRAIATLGTPATVGRIVRRVFVDQGFPIAGPDLVKP